MRNRFSIELWFLISGPMIWLAHFLSIYTLNALRCARPQSWLAVTWMTLPVSSWMILLASVLALCAMAWVAIRQNRRTVSSGQSAFHAKLTSTLCLLSAMAVVWQTMPVFLVAECD
ncbi:hypothetical protein [Bordetella muralis]|jgi:hypothetical protein|uniref:hypothetical protein n=1 Tax=Bordetella muralis TaxID=1649130 RepID=UPI0039EF84BB